MLTWISSTFQLKFNVADIGTSGASPPCLDYDSSWQLGPAFLRDPENEWPRGPTEQVCDGPLELTKPAHSGTVCVFLESSLIDLEDYSTLWKAKRVVACVLRCVQKFKSTLTKANVLVNRSPSVEVLRQAENVLIRVAQRESFGREIDCLVRGEPIPKNSKLVKITPFIDDKGLLRAKGRLEKMHRLLWTPNQSLASYGLRTTTPNLLMGQWTTSAMKSDTVTGLSVVNRLSRNSVNLAWSVKERKADPVLL